MEPGQNEIFDGPVDNLVRHAATRLLQVRRAALPTNWATTVSKNCRFLPLYFNLVMSKFLKVRIFYFMLSFYFDFGDFVKYFFSKVKKLPDNESQSFFWRFSIQVEDQAFEETSENICSEK